MGVLYAKLFHQEIHSYLPYLTSGMVIWNLLSMLISDSTSVFSSAEGIIRQVKIPATTHILRMIAKNLIIFFHNLVVFIVIAFLFKSHFGWADFLFPLSLFVWVANALWVGLLLGALCARYRDIGQIIISIVQILFFLTPVMWRPESLGKYAWISRINPLTQYFDLLRDPLLGQFPSYFSWIYVFTVTLAGWVLTMVLFSKYRGRLAYWV